MEKRGTERGGANFVVANGAKVLTWPDGWTLGRAASVNTRRDGPLELGGDERRSNRRPSAENSQRGHTKAGLAGNQSIWLEPHKLRGGLLAASNKNNKKQKEAAMSRISSMARFRVAAALEEERKKEHEESIAARRNCANHNSSTSKCNGGTKELMVVVGDEEQRPSTSSDGSSTSGFTRGRLPSVAKFLSARRRSAPRKGL